MSDMTPCLNPTLCGVRNHRSGTNPKCMVRSMDGGTSKLSAIDYSKISLSQTEPLSRTLTGKADVKRVEDFIKSTQYPEIEYGSTPSGTWQYLMVLENDLYDSMDSPLGGRITTRDGLEAYAYEAGGPTNVVLNDGSTYSARISPSTDEGARLPEMSLSLKEVNALESIYDIALDVSHRENIPGDVDSMSHDDQVRALSHRIVESRESKVAAHWESVRK